MKSKPIIGVIGAGAIGLFVSNQFTKHGYKVCLITKEIKQNEFFIIENQNSHSFNPILETKLNCKIDYLFVAIKFHHLESALKKIPINFINNALIIPFINGFLHFNKIENLLNQKNVIASMIGGINASKVSNEVRVIRSNFEIMLSTNNVNLKSNVNLLNQLLNSVQLRSKVYENESQVIWNKLSRLSIVSSLTATTQMPLGYIKKSKKWRKIMLNLIDEVVLISIANGYMINKNELLFKILNMPDNLTTSLQRDIANNQESELDAIVGAVISSGKQFKCSTNTFEYIYNLIKVKLNK
jgi:2-dehydropantoate 2-reductase